MTRHQEETSLAESKHSCWVFLPAEALLTLSLLPAVHSACRDSSPETWLRYLLRSLSSGSVSHPGHSEPAHPASGVIWKCHTWCLSLSLGSELPSRCIRSRQVQNWVPQWSQAGRCRGEPRSREAESGSTCLAGLVTLDSWLLQRPPELAPYLTKQHTQFASLLEAPLQAPATLLGSPHAP